MSGAAPSSSVRPRIILVAAVAENGVIGRDGGLPWHLPDDLRHFRDLTLGKTCIMGRATFEEVERTCGGPLPGRRCIVITRSRRALKGAEVASSLDVALGLAAGDADVFIIGGARLYTDALDRADRLEITIVHGAPEGDTTFPVIDSSMWDVTHEQHHPKDDRHDFPMTFRTYERR